MELVEKTQREVAEQEKAARFDKKKAREEAMLKMEQESTDQHASSLMSAVPKSRKTRDVNRYISYQHRRR